MDTVDQLARRDRRCTSDRFVVLSSVETHKEQSKDEHTHHHRQRQHRLQPHPVDQRAAHGTTCGGQLQHQGGDGSAGRGRIGCRGGCVTGRSRINRLPLDWGCPIGEGQLRNYPSDMALQIQLLELYHVYHIGWGRTHRDAVSWAGLDQHRLRPAGRGCGTEDGSAFCC